jgi:hypothetical protein
VNAAGRLPTTPPPPRTPPPTLRREGTNNHGRAPGKLRGRSFILLRQPISAMPTATHRRHTISRPGDIQDTPGRPPRSLQASSFNDALLENPSKAISRVSCGERSLQATARCRPTNGFFTHSYHNQRAKRMPLSMPLSNIKYMLQ